MEALAVVLNSPEDLAVRTVALTAPGDADVVVDIDWSGISTGTERLLFQGRMPPFPGLGYPLVPGYESVGRIAAAGPANQHRIGETVFVPGATCYGEIRGLFGGASSRVVMPAARAVPIDPALAEKGVLIALAATAQHAIVGPVLPDLIVGHGVVGRLLARLVIAAGGPAPTVWETNPQRQDGATGYQVLHPDADTRRDYRCICDASGDSNILDTLVMRLAFGGEIVLAGFYADRVSFAFPMAFIKEARFRIAAQWQPADLETVRQRIADGTLSLDGLITHRMTPSQADQAYRTAFGDSTCLKMILDWRTHS
ncbi:chlorophyll synthesis pathway protein BchC [Rhodopila globiformis]|uniref:Chlorophyll synthesis pathway protein BchC n=1 Tax=Rhodopila globiformis TaxID=1071 RepID=A0A2S6NEL5_RHOGL|nr:chlorophyll synthesis pathway protein BchC [Rhodopila globiformis]PPQ33051.1 chlorophyll synthesis pathway protein BchC [Rhodopila globiformis]